jgi:vitamin B12 transporter
MTFYTLSRASRGILELHMTRSHSILSAALLTAVFGTPLSAQDAFDLDAVTFFANANTTELSRAGASVTVISEEELAETAETRVIDYLRRVAGVSVTATGPIGTHAGVSIRGVTQSNIVVLIDGIDVSDPSGTQVAFDFGGLTTADVSRIEIMRGSQSAGYGSEAIGGVINITTNRATEDGFRQSTAIEYGSYNTFSAVYGFSNRGVGHETAVTLSHIRSDGFSAADENNGNP